MKKLIIIVTLLLTTICLALGNDTTIKSIRQYASDQGITQAWINSRTNAQIYQLLDIQFDFTSEQRLKVLKNSHGLRAMLLRDAQARLMKEQQRSFYLQIKTSYPIVRVLRQTSGDSVYFIVTIDGSDPNAFN